MSADDVRTYLPGEAVPRTGYYDCLGSTPTGDLCPSSRMTFSREKGSRFPHCANPHGTVRPKWMGPLRDSDYRISATANGHDRSGR